MLRLRTLPKWDIIVAGPGKNAGKGFLTGPNLLEKRVSEVGTCSANAKSVISAANLNLAQLFGPRNRQGSQPNRIQQLEDRGVSPDTESKRQHNYSGESGRLIQCSKCEAEIMPARLQKGLPAGRANDFLRNFESALLKPNRATSFPVAQAILHLFGGCHLQVSPHFLVQFPVHLLLLEQ